MLFDAESFILVKTLQNSRMGASQTNCRLKYPAIIFLQVKKMLKISSSIDDRSPTAHGTIGYPLTPHGIYCVPVWVGQERKCTSPPLVMLKLTPFARAARLTLHDDDESPMRC